MAIEGLDLGKDFGDALDSFKAKFSFAVANNGAFATEAFSPFGKPSASPVDSAVYNPSRNGPAPM